MLPIKSGDISLVYSGTIWGLVSPLIKVCTTEWWKGEHITKVYHAELIVSPSDDGYIALSAQPPVSKLVTRSLKGKHIFRLHPDVKPVDFNDKLMQFVIDNKGRLYDVPAFITAGFDWLLHTRKFTKLATTQGLLYCAELVAKFYEQIKIPCSPHPSKYTMPDDILDYCSTNDNFIQID